MIKEGENYYKNISSIRETVIREKLKRMFPLVPEIEIMFCAYELIKFADGYRDNPSYNGGKC